MILQKFVVRKPPNKEYTLRFARRLNLFRKRTVARNYENTIGFYKFLSVNQIRETFVFNMSSYKEHNFFVIVFSL